MGEYTGSAIAACWNGVSFPNVTRISWEESADIPKLDTTSGGDATQQRIDGIPNAKDLTWTITGWDESGTSNAIPTGSSFAAQTSGSIDVYPEGASASGKKWKYCHVAYISRRTSAPAINEVTPYEVTIVNKASGSWTDSVTS